MIQRGCENSGNDLADKLNDIKLSQAMFWVIKIFVLHIKINKQKACKDPRSHIALMSPLYPSGMRMFFTRPRFYALHICEGLRPVSLEPAPHFRHVRCFLLVGWVSGTSVGMLQNPCQWPLLFPPYPGGWHALLAAFFLPVLTLVAVLKGSDPDFSTVQIIFSLVE